MKTLRVDHSQANSILKGSRVVWQPYGEEELLVNDEVQIIEPLDSDLESGESIGQARIIKVVHKRLGEVEAEEYEPQGFSSLEEVFEAYGQKYSHKVTKETPIMLVYFVLSPRIKSIKYNNELQIHREIKLFADGGSRGNPGPSAAGFVIMDLDGNIVVKKGVYLGVTTNNQAEYQAIKIALEEAQKMQAQIVHVYLDSLLVVNQMLGKFKVKNRDLWPIHSAVKELSKYFKKITFIHVPRELNKLADAQVNEALDRALDR